MTKQRFSANFSVMSIVVGIMKLLQTILLNGYIPIIPILVWNVLFASKLPPAYDINSFNSNIPLGIIIGENLFRSVIFLIPLFCRLKTTLTSYKKGLLTFSLGVALYFASWLMLIYAPNSGWSTGVLGFTAPAYTPIIWLIGLSLMLDSYYFRVRYSKWHLIVSAVAFSIFHLAHSVYVYYRTY